MQVFFNKVKNQFANQLPFVIYSKPNQKESTGFFQKDDTLYLADNYEEKGFIFTNFEGTKSVLIPEKDSEIVTVSNDLFQNGSDSFSEIVTNNGSQVGFEELVSKGLEAIRHNQFQKVVLSRMEFVKISDLDLTIVFQRLVMNYPSAFCYCFFHPKVGLWLGGFSEQLLQLKGNRIKTMAVAGTQVNVQDANIIWNEKELDEQQIVTDFILKSIENRTKQVRVSKPYTLQAGNVVHIKTDIEASLNPEVTLKELLSVLHPTPAVCGLPKEAAQTFIREYEGYDRAFYSGFLGELNCHNQTDLYVNLRCMQIQNNQVQIYVGCGITKDSIPKMEWKETQNKSETIKKVLL